VKSGRLPNGLSLNPTGVISGTPSSVDSSFLTFQVTDSGSPAQTATANLTMTIQPQGSVSISTASLANGLVGVAYSQTLNAAGGQTPYTWSLISGALPSGLTLAASTGVISGTPSATASNLLTFRVTDSSSPAQTATAALTLTIVSLSPSITTFSLAPGQVGVAYSQTLTAAGGQTPYTWSLISGVLPSGLTLGSSTGVISGTPSATASNLLTFRVTDSSTPAQTATASLALTITAAPTLSITTASLPNGQVGVAYSQTVSATGGTGAYTWSATGLPAGLSISVTTGVISGTPTATGTSTVSVTVMDSGSPQQTATKNLSLTVQSSAGPLAITTTSLANGQVGVFYSQTLAATGGTGPYTWSVSFGRLPNGLSLNPSSGVISGTPTSSYGGFMTIQVTDSGSPAQTATANLTMTVN
jgi:hypothetical protein